MWYLVVKSCSQQVVDRVVVSQLTVDRLTGRQVDKLTGCSFQMDDVKRFLKMKLTVRHTLLENKMKITSATPCFVVIT